MFFMFFMFFHLWFEELYIHHFDRIDDDAPHALNEKSIKIMYNVYLHASASIATFGAFSKMTSPSEANTNAT